jgi:hypothetical protein
LNSAFKKIGGGSSVAPSHRSGTGAGGLEVDDNNKSGDIGGLDVPKSRDESSVDKSSMGSPSP